MRRHAKNNTDYLRLVAVHVGVQGAHFFRQHCIVAHDQI